MLFFIDKCRNTMKQLPKNIPFIWNILCGVSSLLSLGLLIFGDKNAVIVALTFFCLSLISINILIVKAVSEYLKIGRSAESDIISIDIKYETSDGYNIDYNVYKVIQSKSILLKELKHGFKWTGSKEPKISSNLQECINTKHNIDDDSFNFACLNLKTPLYYNQTALLHFRAEMNDSDQRSETMISCKVSSFIEIIKFRVILKHINYDSKAKLYKRKINSLTLNKEKEIATIPFDINTKTYEYIQERPEIGFFYILRWER